MAAEVGETPEETTGQTPRVEAPVVPAPVVKIEQPLEAKEFDEFLGIFMSKAGISDRRKAAVLAARALRNIGLDPATHLDEAVKGTQFLASVLSILPDAGEVTRATKDVIVAQGASRMGERLLEGPTPEERMERTMQMMMPYIMVMRLATGGGDMGGSAGTKSAELAAVEAKLASVEEKLKEKPIEELKGVVQGLRDEIKELKAGKPREDGESKVEKILGELKAAYSEGKGKSEIGEKLDNLTKALTEKEHASELDGIKHTVDGVKTDVLNKIASLEASMGKGATQQGDQMKQAGDLFSSIGNLYKGAGEMAKSLGYEPKDEKMSGDLRRDILGLGKKALEVVEKGFKYQKEPGRQVVQQLPPVMGQPMVIPTGEVPGQTITEAGQTANLESGSHTPQVTAPEQAVVPVAPFAKKPKVEAPAAVVPPETGGSAAETPAVPEK